VTNSTKICFTKRLLDLSLVTFSATSVTSRVVEIRTGKMATANKLAVLQKIKQKKGVFLWVIFERSHKTKEM